MEGGKSQQSEAMTQDISTKFIELNSFLKVKGVEATGGKIKLLIKERKIKVNGEVETRNKRKLHEGDVIEYLDMKFTIEPGFLR